MAKLFLEKFSEERTGEWGEFLNDPGQTRYPVGVSRFSEIREGGYLYVDKTDYVYRMTHGAAKYIFLSRPNGFGKSVLVTTLKSYFEGRKDLFNSLAIEGIETEWTEYPVVSLDLSVCDGLDWKGLERFLISRLTDLESQYGVRSTGSDEMGVRVTRLIKKIHQKTGKQVVVLMDGCDAVMRDMIDEERIEPMRRTLAKFLLGFNDCETCLRFFFITGVRKFDPQCYFDCLKGIKDISMEEEYAAVCGFTESEIQPYINERIAFIAKKSNDEPAEIKTWMKRINKGYHFAWPSAAVFCPYSLLRFLSSGDEGDYWYDKYATSHMLEFLEKYDVHPVELSVLELPKEVFYAPMEQVKSILPWLYQCGYITIREYDNERGIYRLDFPNTEFSTRICRDYLPKYFRTK